jgi:hypothetical protein
VGDLADGRGLAIYLTVFYGSMTIGSVLWGQVASSFSLPVSLVTASAGAALALLMLWRASLPTGEADLSPARPWPDPVSALSLEGAQAPVCVLIEYRVEPARTAEFLSLLRLSSDGLRRNGAFRWQAFEDGAQPGAVLEMFFEHSWAEHERHHHRVTAAEADLLARIRGFHLGPELPHVRHLLAR